MQEKQEATPWGVDGPRIYSANKTLIATVAHFRDSAEERANAEFIVRACNEYQTNLDLLVKAGRWVRELEVQRDDLVTALQAVVEAGRMSDQSRAAYCAEIARAALSRSGVA